MNTQELLLNEKKYVMNTYSRADVEFVKGDGCWLYDSKGKKYLDFLAGIAVCSLGHADKNLNRVLSGQATKLWHTSNLFHIAPQIELAKKLGELTGGYKSFFCNSGAEANEGAIKLARLYGKTFNKGKTLILSLDNSFHGRTLATITATGQKKYQAGLEPLPSQFKYVKPNNIADLRKKVTPHVCAIMLEFLQGEGGVNLLEKSFVDEVFKLAKQHSFLVIADEVQAGLCRTGKFFAFQNFGVKPDVFTLAKSLGNGFPIGALIAKPQVADLFKPGKHASTFGGNFLASSVANAVLDTMRKKKLDSHAAKMGLYFSKKLEKLKTLFPDIVLQVKGKGLMVGLALSKKIEASSIVKKAREKGLIMGTAGENILRFVPPLIIGTKEIDKATGILTSIFTEGN